jgi:hypothetical protein
MEPQYNVADHGDLLEKMGADFIRSHFPNYEVVWAQFIGNRGNATRAPLPNYPDEGKRQSFGEHSYSTYESCFMIHGILESGVFMTEIKSAADYIRLNQSFTLFFAYLGRIHDTVLKAAQDLFYNHTAFEQTIKEFYEARSIVIHGKKVPILLDSDGFLIMPQLKTENARGTGWNDKNNLWEDVARMTTNYVEDTCGAYFYELLDLINKEYGVFSAVIAGKLAERQTKLIFDRSAEGTRSRSFSADTTPSGSTAFPRVTVGVNVYNFNWTLGEFGRDKRSQ